MKHKNFPHFSLHITPRRYIPRGVFWTVSILLVILFVGGSLVYLDRNVWYSDFADILPSYTEFLLVLPVNSQDSDLENMKEILSFVPGTNKYLERLEPQVILSSLIIFEPIFEFWNQNKNNFSGKISLAGVDKNIIASFQIANADFLREDAVRTENFLGADIFELKNFDGLFAWFSSKQLIVGTDKDTIKNLIKNKRSLQFSYRHKINAADYDLLVETNFYKNSLLELGQDNLMTVYVNSDISGYSWNLWGQISELLPMQLSLPNSSLDFSRSQKIFFVLEVLSDSFALKATAPAEEYVSTKSIYAGYLLTNIPANLADVNIDLAVSTINQDIPIFEFQDSALSFFENNLSGRIVPWQDFVAYIKPEAVKDLKGRVTVLSGSDQSGKPEVIIIAEKPPEEDGQALGEKLMQTLYFLSSEANYKIVDNFVAASTIQNALTELANNWQYSNTFATEVKDILFDDKLLSFSYLNTDLFTKYARYSIGNSQTGAIRALEALNRAVPYIKTALSVKSGLLVGSTFVKVNPIPAARNTETNMFLESVEKIDSALGSSLPPASRDSSRLADATILQTVITQFKQRQGRAPVNLGELIPVYLSDIPFDPQTNEVYEYSNIDGDSSFYIIFNFETDTSLQGSGLYCLTSMGLEKLDELRCVEK